MLSAKRWVAATGALQALVRAPAPLRPAAHADQPRFALAVSRHRGKLQHLRSAVVATTLAFLLGSALPLAARHPTSSTASISAPPGRGVLLTMAAAFAAYGLLLLATGARQPCLWLAFTLFLLVRAAGHALLLQGWRATSGPRKGRRGEGEFYALGITAAFLVLASAADAAPRDWVAGHKPE